jgi:hypothetical protein
MTTLIDPSIAHLGDFRAVLWGLYLAAAVILPIYHVRPILRYLRGSNGIGDACVRTEALQCLWRVPALLYSVFVAPSLPLFLSIFLDLLGRIGRVLAMHASRRRWQAGHPPATAREQDRGAAAVTLLGGPSASALQGRVVDIIDPVAAAFWRGFRFHRQGTHPRLVALAFTRSRNPHAINDTDSHHRI